MTENYELFFATSLNFYFTYPITNPGFENGLSHITVIYTYVKTISTIELYIERKTKQQTQNTFRPVAQIETHYEYLC
jgi:hypothetical protein